jgi:putative ribosome biogenesis GTPase RsgA
VSVSFRSVDSERQMWEDRINASFAKIRSFERVCNHADCTVIRDDHCMMTECDYCSAWSTTSEQVPKIPPPAYFMDREPLLL